MATDLIPPPSPAGRPEPESSESAGRIAAHLWSGGEVSPRRVSVPPPAHAAATTAPAPPPYRSRFGFIVGALFGVALAIIGLGTILALNASKESAPDGWSSWRPSSEEELVVAKQVAEYVGVKYRLGDLEPARGGEIERHGDRRPALRRRAPDRERSAATSSWSTAAA